MESPMVSSKKEGYLYKWTNYLSGWQQRYFVLESDKDTLTYYRNPDEVGRGCRGAVKLSSCQLNVHPSDQCRLDLTIPSQSICYCIRAQSARDRQDWLVAFSTAKACRSNKSSFSPRSISVLPPSNGHSKSCETTPPNLSPASANINSVSLCNSSHLILTKASKCQIEVSDDIREKAGQMRLFADLLNQQMSSLRTEFNSCSSLVASANQSSGNLEISLENSNNSQSEEKSNGSPVVPQTIEDRTNKIAGGREENTLRESVAGETLRARAVPRKSPHKFINRMEERSEVIPVFAERIVLAPFSLPPPFFPFPNNIGGTSVLRYKVDGPTDALFTRFDWKEQSESSLYPDVGCERVKRGKILEENRNLFDETCDAFLMTVSDLCVMVDAKVAQLDKGSNKQNYTLKHSGSSSRPGSFADEVQSQNVGSMSGDQVDNRNSNSECSSASKSPLKQKDSTDSNVFLPSSNTRRTRLSSSGFKSSNGSTSGLDSIPTVPGNCLSRSPSLSSVQSSGSDNEMHLKTFFATVTKIFQSTVSSDTNELALRNVLKACGEFVLFFDVLYYTILPPIKSGIISNTKRLQMVLDEFSTVEEVLKYEKTQNLFATKHSSTQCIIWLYRDLSFMREFLTEVLTGEQSLSTAAGHSYSKTLKAYNGWVVRGVYAVAFKSLPYRSDFINALCKSTDALDYATIERCVLKDMDKFVRVLSVFLCKLQNLLLSNNILASSDNHLA